MRTIALLFLLCSIGCSNSSNAITARLHGGPISIQDVVYATIGAVSIETIPLGGGFALGFADSSNVCNTKGLDGSLSGFLVEMGNLGTGAAPTGAYTVIDPNTFGATSENLIALVQTELGSVGAYGTNPNGTVTITSIGANQGPLAGSIAYTDGSNSSMAGTFSAHYCSSFQNAVNTALRVEN